MTSAFRFGKSTFIHLFLFIKNQNICAKFGEFPTGIHWFKVNNANHTAVFRIYSKLTAVDSLINGHSKKPTHLINGQILFSQSQVCNFFDSLKGGHF